jgi:hypothetical protein
MYQSFIQHLDNEIGEDGANYIARGLESNRTLTKLNLERTSVSPHIRQYPW